MERKRVICINGKFMPASEAVIPALDGGVLYGQGLFETILVKDWQPVFMERHLKRLAGSSAGLSIALPFSPAELEVMLRETIERNGLATGAVRVTLTAGVEGGQAGLIIHSRPLPYTREHYNRGFKAGFVSIRRNERSPLVSHKTTSYFENILARREAVRRGLDEGLFLNTRGEVAEGAVSNIFLVRDKKVITPDRESGLLPGIMRGVVIEACRQLGIPVEERKVLPEELKNCDEAFITNSLMGVMPLASVDGRTIGKGASGEVAGLLNREIQGKTRQRHSGD